MMHRLRISSLAGCLCVAFAAHAYADTNTNTNTNSTIVNTDRGPVQGSSSASGRQFLGIPYAAPPVGALRWRPPQRAADWNATRDATQFGANCAQGASPFGQPSTSEDCLFLNVYTPPVGPLNGALQRAPVLVWIHGGAFRYGEGSDYDPAQLVQRGIVVVTINYRIGALGFLAHPALTAESPDQASGNYGLMDQQAALGWVQRNIASFGGNPNNVTIAGESAGGASVHAQLVSTGAAGLFQGAIAQSGAYTLTEPTLSAAEAQGTTLATALGCSDAACLRAVPVDTLLAAENPGPFGYLPDVDGKVLTQSIGPALASGSFNQVPVIEGSNHDEWRFFVALSYDLAKGPLTADAYPSAVASLLSVPTEVAQLVVQQYPLSNYSSPDLAFAALGTDAVFACNALAVSNSLQQYVPTWEYEFNDPDAPEWFLPPVSFPYASAHASELQYLFQLRPNLPNPPALNADQQQLSDLMVRYWAEFTRAGNPNGLVTPNWVRFLPPVSQRIEQLTPPTPQAYTATSFQTDHKCAFWASLAAQQ